MSAAALISPGTHRQSATAADAAAAAAKGTRANQADECKERWLWKRVGEMALQ